MANNVTGWLKWARWLEKLSNKDLMSVILAILIILGTSFLWTPFTATRLFLFFIYAVGVFATSLLIVRLISHLINKLQNNRKKKSILSNPEVIDVLKEVNSQANEISQNNSLRGLPIPVNNQLIADTLQLSIDQVGSDIYKLISIGFIKGHIPNEVYDTSPEAKEYLLKNPQPTTARDGRKRRP